MNRSLDGRLLTTEALENIAREDLGWTQDQIDVSVATHRKGHHSHLKDVTRAARFDRLGKGLLIQDSSTREVSPLAKE